MLASYSNPCFCRRYRSRSRKIVGSAVRTIIMNDNHPVNRTVSRAVAHRAIIPWTACGRVWPRAVG
jgi:hypothetical protein